jgi:hypothetical protein
MQDEFATRGADETMETMAEAPSVDHVPVPTGGSAVIRRCSRYIREKGPRCSGTDAPVGCYDTPVQDPPDDLRDPLRRPLIV